MEKKKEIDWTDLAFPFEDKDIEWRIQRAGEKNGKIWAIAIPYVTNRAIMDRLDRVVGQPNWKNEFKAAPEGGVLCGISIRISNPDARVDSSDYNEWVTKWDGAENTNIEKVKGGLSGSMKRAAVQWGMGRHLYHVKEKFAKVHSGGEFSGKTKEGKYFNWDAPSIMEDKSFESQAEKGTTTNFEFLKVVRAEKKRVGEGPYYAVLEVFGYKKSNKVVKKEEQVKVYRELQKIPDFKKGGE